MWNRFDKSVFAEILHPDIRFWGWLGQVKVGFEEFGEYVDFIQGSILDDAGDPLSPEDDKKMASEFPTPDMALTHILVVEDVNRSSAWYENVLGAELYRKSGSSVVFKFNESWLLLVNGGEPTKDKPDVSFSPPERTAVHHSFTIRVEHCQAAYETLRDRGAEFLTPPYDWGPEIRCFFPDPDGHLWEISQLT
jgi:catechol 2,3-dioxygenase-like lactoylglutathione lyase family enzyme